MAMTENINVEELQEDQSPIGDPTPEETVEEGVELNEKAEEQKPDGPLLAAAKAVTAQRRSRGPRNAAAMPDRDQALQEIDDAGNQNVGMAAEAHVYGRSNANDILPIIEQLRVSRKRHWILSGMIVSVEPKDGQICAIIMEGDVKIVIPCNEFFEKPPVAMDRDSGMSPEEMRRDQMKRESTLMANYLGTTVNYIVTDLRTTSTRADRGVYAFAVTASRKLALAAIRKRRFAADARNPIEVGSRLTGTILAVSYNTLRVCVEGVDKTLYKANITNRYIDDLHNEYHNGDSIDVIVTKLERDSDGELRDIEFSARAVENEEQSSRFGTLTVGGKVLAKVKAIRGGNGGRTVNYILDIPAYRISALAQSSYVLGDNMAGRPQLGENVLFLVKEISDAGVVGVIIRRL